jgi:hypothetical protein
MAISKFFFSQYVWKSKGSGYRILSRIRETVYVMHGKAHLAPYVN